MQAIRWGVCLVLGLSAMAALGCNMDDGPATYPVTGTVTRGGQPVEGVAVTFVPEGEGPSARGVTDAAGKYSLTTRKKDDGAVPGKYKVMLAKYEGEQGETTDPSQAHADYDISNEYPEGYDESRAGDAPPSANTLPPQYSNPDTSGFTADVAPTESNNFDFNIEG